MKLKALTIFLLCGFSINASSSSHPQKSDKNTILSIPELRSFSHQTTMTFLKERKEIALFVNDTLKLSHLPRSMFKKRGVKVSHC